MSADSNIVPVNPRPALVAGHRPTAIVPQTMDEAYRLAKAVSVAGLAPPGLETPEKVMIAIMTGLEVGLTPMAAIQRVAVINGRTTIWGDGAMGLVRASGLCEWVKERVEGDGDKRVAVCEAKRRNDPEPVRRTFSVADAKGAGLWDDRAIIKRRNKAGEWYEKANDSPWHRYPERMMQMRARAFALRDLFADVLGGLYIREEIEEASDEQTSPAAPRRAPPPPPAIEAPRRAPPPPQSSGNSGQLAPTSPPQTQGEDTSFVDLTEAEVTAPASLLQQLEDDLAACTTGEAFDDVSEAWNERIGNMPPADRQKALELKEKHGERLS